MNSKNRRKQYNFALNDQISMFSSQDKGNGFLNKLNTSDNNNADTLERDASPLISQD